MSLSMFHSLWTVAVLVIFIGIIIWAFSEGRKTDFDEAARLPLEDEVLPGKTDDKAEQQ